MHRFLRSVGFSNITTRNDLKKLIAKTISDSSKRQFVTYENDTFLAEYSLDYGSNMGITVCGEMDSEDKFIYDYFFPYMSGEKIGTEEESSIEKRMDRISYAGLCEDKRIGIAIIYYLRNRMDYIKNSYKSSGTKGISLTLSGLSDNGTIVMPLEKNINSKKKADVSIRKHNKLVEEARQGNEEAIEFLTLEDLDVYSTLSQKIKKADVYTLVDTFFMPYGVECDMYSIMGEIEKVKEVENTLTKEKVYQLSLLCNEIPIDICINKQDLYGEPEVGRRFKGNVWLQGYLNYPEE